jgi:hypothetical protein
MPVPAPEGGGFDFDVFLSYRNQDPDKTWVRKALDPRLRDAGLRVCVDYRDFRLGAPAVTEMERAVEASRYTVAVLTPAYLAGPFTEFENVLAQHLGLEQSRLRLLLVLREPCDPGLRLRHKLWLEMTSGAEVEDNLPRLVEALRQDPNA